jgi:hypothetical protein
MFHVLNLQLRIGHVATFPEYIIIKKGIPRCIPSVGLKIEIPCYGTQLYDSDKNVRIN